MQRLVVPVQCAEQVCGGGSQQQAAVPSIAAVVVLLRKELQRQLERGRVAGKGAAAEVEGGQRS